MAQNISPLAGHPAPQGALVDVAKLREAYFQLRPAAREEPAQRVAFGTSGHRGISFERSFNEWHILAITQAICEYRSAHGISGPLFIGADTHALSPLALETALEVLAANAVEVMTSPGGRIHPDPRDFARDPHLQQGSQRRPCRWHRRHSFAQPA
jgi:phosphoglucomutase